MRKLIVTLGISISTAILVSCSVDQKEIYEDVISETPSSNHLTNARVGKSTSNCSSYLHLQRKALAAIYNTNSNHTLDWNLSDTNIGNWTGVTTNVQGYVTNLNLHSKGIDNIPRAIKFLCELRQLQLDNNNLSYLPSEIGSLSKLNYLGLSFNELSSLPQSMSQLSNLRWIGLSYNNFSAIPSAMLELENLEELNMFSNSIGPLASVL